MALAQSQLEEGQRRGLYTPPEGPPLVVADYELTFLTRALEVDTQDEVVAHQSGSGGGSGREDRQGRSGSGARQRDREREKEREKGRESKFRVSGRDRGRDQMADRVMCQVAEECGLVPSSSDHREASRGEIVVEREREGGRVGSSGSQGSNGLGLGLGLGQGQGLTSNAHSHSLNRSSSDLVLLRNRVVIAKT